MISTALILALCTTVMAQTQVTTTTVPLTTSSIGQTTAGSASATTVSSTTGSTVSVTATTPAQATTTTTGASATPTTTSITAAPTTTRATTTRATTTVPLTSAATAAPTTVPTTAAPTTAAPTSAPTAVTVPDFDCSTCVGDLGEDGDWFTETGGAVPESLWCSCCANNCGGLLNRCRNEQNFCESSTDGRCVFDLVQTPIWCDFPAIQTQAPSPPPRPTAAPTPARTTFGGVIVNPDLEERRDYVEGLYDEERALRLGLGIGLALFFCLLVLAIAYFMSRKDEGGVTERPAPQAVPVVR